MKGALWIIAFILFIVIMLGITGKWDYEEARRQECAEYNQSYDADKDACYKENIEETK